LKGLLNNFLLFIKLREVDLSRKSHGFYDVDRDLMFITRSIFLLNLSQYLHSTWLLEWQRALFRFDLKVSERVIELLSIKLRKVDLSRKPHGFYDVDRDLMFITRSICFLNSSHYLHSTWLLEWQRALFIFDWLDEEYVEVEL